MSVKGLADYDAYGNREYKPKWPFMMRLLPNDVCGIPDHYTGNFAESVYRKGCIPAGTTLFDVFAMAEPKELGGKEQLIGHIVTTSKMVTSTYGDTRLFFRHQRFEEDLAARPEWRPFVEDFRKLGHTRFADQLPLPTIPPKDACPMSFLFGLM